MLIENSDALLAWLSALLEPLCDADPAALSKYVVALIKKDKPESELRESMVAQMEVFLQEHTIAFIDTLFQSLESKDYLDGPPKVSIKKDKSDDEDDSKAKYEEGKPDSTTSTPANVSELSADLRDAEHRSSKRLSDEDRSRRRSPRDRRSGGSPPRRRRNSGHRGRYRSRSRSPSGRRTSPFGRRGGRRGSPFGRRSRSRSFSPRRSSRSPPPRRYASRGSTPTRDEEGYTPTATTAKRPRCRDYDEKGFCLRGDQCKFDHGNDAVVLEDTTNTSVPPPYLPGSYAEPYVPANTGPVLPPLHLPPPGYPATTVAVPRKRPYDDSGNGSYPPNKRFDFNRLGGRGRGRGRGGGPGGRPGGSSQVLVKNIPQNLNTIAHMNNHFTRFGTLVNVQIHYEGDPSAALVSFTHPHEATAAMSSSEAVLGNRFIKMFFTHQDRGNVKERLGELVSEKVTMDGKTITKTIVNTEANKDGEAPVETPEETAAKESKKAAAIAAIKKNQEVLEIKAKMKKEAEEKKAEAVKLTDELRKSKQELLEKLINEQKKLILKMEEKKLTLKNEEKSSMMTLLKSLSASIEKTKEDLKTIISQQSSQTMRKSFIDVQKELLDAELELFNAQQDGADNTEDIQKRVNMLRIEAAQKGMLPTSRPPRGGRGASPFRGSYRGYPRGGAYHRGRVLRGGFRGGRGGRGAYAHPGTTSLDRRPTTICVTNYEADEKDAVVVHMGKFGEILETTEDEEAKALTFQYKTRREAEMAMLKARTFGEKELKMIWQTSVLNDSSELDHEESEHSGLDDQSDLLDDYTPLDPSYLPPGLEEEDSNSKANAEELGEEEEPKQEEEEEEEEEDDEGRSWKR